MEKQGMERRKRFHRAGLLILLLLFFAAGLLFAQADEGDRTAGDSTEEIPPLEIRVEISPANPVVNNPWAVYILVNHPIPSEVNIRPPRFPPALVLERVRTETRLIQKESAAAENTAGAPAVLNERWTRVEFLFTPRRTGAVVIEPFEVSAPGRRAVSAGITAGVREETNNVTRYEPRFRWISVPPVPSGERGELLLELSGWDPSVPPPKSIFRGNTPGNAIVEEKLQSETGEGVYRYTVTVIPLGESDVALAPFSFAAGDPGLAVPGINVQVLPAGPVKKTDAPALPSQGNSESFPSDDAPAPLPGAEILRRPFSENRKKVFPLFRGNYERIAANVQALWDSGCRAEALAEIRRNERDSLPGPYLASLRGEMERALGLDFTEDENWRPLRIPLPAWFFLGFLALCAGIVLFVFRPRPKFHRPKTPPDAALQTGSFESEVPSRSVTSFRRRGFKIIIISVFFVGLILILLEEGLGDILTGRLSIPGNAAVLEGTPAYRVPDLRGAVNVQFGDGQPVTVSEYQGDWCYAESPDGRSGWVPRQTVIMY